MVQPRGTPEQRRVTREQNRRNNRINHIRSRATRAGSGHQLVVIACNAAQAASRRIVDDARRRLAQAIAQAVETFDTPANWKDPR